MAPKIRVLLNFKKSHLEIAADAVAVYEGLKDKPLSNPPIALEDFKAIIDRYTIAIANANDGGKQALRERNNLRDTLVQTMRRLGHWVEAMSNGNVNTFLSTGFKMVSTAPRVASGTPAEPLVLKVESGASSGQLVLTVQTIRRARSYELRYAAVGPDGATGEWTLLPPYTRSRSMSVTGLTPGTVYSFQTRAFCRGGYTEWSHAVNRMSL